MYDFEVGTGCIDANTWTRDTGCASFSGSKSHEAAGLGTPLKSIRLELTLPLMPDAEAKLLLHVNFCDVGEDALLIRIGFLQHILTGFVDFTCGCNVNSSSRTRGVSLCSCLQRKGSLKWNRLSMISLSMSQFTAEYIEVYKLPYPIIQSQNIYPLPHW